MDLAGMHEKDVAKLILGNTHRRGCDKDRRLDHEVNSVAPVATARIIKFWRKAKIVGEYYEFISQDDEDDEVEGEHKFWMGLGWATIGKFVKVSDGKRSVTIRRICQLGSEDEGEVRFNFHELSLLSMNVSRDTAFYRSWADEMGDILPKAAPNIVDLYKEVEVCLRTLDEGKMKEVAEARAEKEKKSRREQAIKSIKAFYDNHQEIGLKHDDKFWHSLFMIMGSECMKEFQRLHEKYGYGKWIRVDDFQNARALHEVEQIHRS